jgi:hypothetical protein
MTALIRSQLLAARTLRSTYAFGLLILALVVAVTIGDIGDVAASDLRTQRGILGVLLTDAGTVTAFLLALIAAARVASDYRYATIAQRVLASPRRSRLLGATFATWGLLAVLVAGGALGLSLIVAGPALDGRHVSLALSSGDVATLVFRLGAATALFAALGVGVGFITRSPQAAVATIFGAFFAEKLLAGVIGDVANALPFALLSRVLDATAPDGALAVGVLAALAGAVAGAAALLLRRRDVS